MNLGRSLRAYGTDKFTITLAEELAENVESLPLEKACELGFPDRSDVDISIGDVEVDEATIQISVTICFFENLNPSCGKVSVNRPRAFDCSIVIERLDGKASATAVISDSKEDEF